MKILELQIQNFLAVQNVTAKLSDMGLVLLQGKNEDEPSSASNGAGKSSIPDALMWCLFGETARGVAGDLVVNEKAKKNTAVAVVLQDGDSIYEVTRYRKHKDWKNGLTVRVWNPVDTYPMAAPTILEKGTEKETEMAIVAILGCSKEVFVASIYAGQEAMPDLPRATDKQLKVLIEEAAGVERLEKAYTIAKDKLNTATAAASVERARVASAETSLASVMAQRAGVEGQFNAFEAERLRKAASYEGICTALAVEIKGFAGAWALSGEAALVARRDEIVGSLSEHSKVLAKRDSLQGGAITAQREADMAMRDFAAAREEVNRIQEHIKQAPLNVGKPCRTCNKPHTAEDVAPIIANLQAELKVAAVKASSLKDKVAITADAVGAAKRVVEDFVKTIPDVSALNAENTQINAKLTEIERTKGAMRLKKAEYDNHKAKAAASLTETNPHGSAIATIDSRLAGFNATLLKSKAGLEALEKETAICEAVVKVFGPAGVRALILDTVTPFLNDRTGDYLSALSDGNLTAVWATLSTTAKGETREKFNIEVENATGAKVFAGLSGGEKRKVRLATMLALQDLVASRATKPIDLWIGDEIDHALDDAGLERLMGILETKARERGTVLVISHNSLTDWADSVATVTKRGGFSHLEGALTA